MKTTLFTNEKSRTLERAVIECSPVEYVQLTKAIKWYLESRSADPSEMELALQLAHSETAWKEV